MVIRHMALARCYLAFDVVSHLFRVARTSERWEAGGRSALQKKKKKKNSLPAPPATVLLPRTAGRLLTSFCGSWFYKGCWLLCILAWRAAFAGRWWYILPFLRQKTPLLFRRTTKQYLLNTCAPQHFYYT